MANKLVGVNFTAEELNLSDEDLREKVNLNIAAEAIDNGYEDLEGNEISGTFLWKNSVSAVAFYCSSGYTRARKL